MTKGLAHNMTGETTMNIEDSVAAHQWSNFMCKDSTSDYQLTKASSMFLTRNIMTDHCGLNHGGSIQTKRSRCSRIMKDADM